MNKKTRVSSRDVAREAGVSQATVSYVLNNVPGIKIKPETRQAVLDTVKRLNYHPSHMARGMKLRRSMAVGVITDRSVTNYNFMKTLEGIKDELTRHNYAITLLFSQADDRTEQEILEYYNSHRLDGILFVFAFVADETIDALNAAGIPYCIIDAHSTGREAHEIGTDHLEYIPEILGAFQRKGAAHAAYFGPLWRHKKDRRIEAFERAAETVGIQNLGCHLCPFEDPMIKETILQILTAKDRPDAILSGNPRYGFFVLKTAAQLGIAVPVGLKTAALGTSIFHDLSHPSVTAVELPLYAMGQSGAAVLAALMQGETREMTVILPSEVHYRESI